MVDVNITCSSLGSYLQTLQNSTFALRRPTQRNSLRSSFKRPYKFLIKVSGRVVDKDFPEANESDRSWQEPVVSWGDRKVGWWLCTSSITDYS